MAQFGKASTKRGKPSYVYAIIGVSLVLFLFGIVAWIFLNIKKTGDYFKENIQLHAYIYRTATDPQIGSLKNYITALPYAVKVENTSPAKKQLKNTTRKTTPSGKSLLSVILYRRVLISM